jgi:hypothetical protein
MIVATTAEEIRAMNCLVVPRRLLESVPGDNVARRKERKGKQRKRKPVFNLRRLNPGLGLAYASLVVCLFLPSHFPLSLSLSCH